jgi:hypothetical protein
MLRDSIEIDRLKKKHEYMRVGCDRRGRKKRSIERRRRLTQDQFKRGAAGEKIIKEILQNKYANVVDNNDKNKFATMDFSVDGEIKIDFEVKNRGNYTHNQFDRDGYTNGLMYGRNKFDYGVERLKLGYKQIILWICKDGIFWWELTDPEKQLNIEYTFGENSAKCIGQPKKDIVYVKTKCLTKLHLK